MNIFKLRRNVICYSILFIACLCCLAVFIYSNSSGRTNTDKREGHKKRTETVHKSHLPAKSELPNLTHIRLAALYHGYISSLQVSCKHIIRLGEEADGGWNVCDDLQYRPSTPCLVYSFGIDYDFSFDDAIAVKYGCEVHSFDPSMDMREGKRKPNVWFHPYAIGDETQILRGQSWQMYTLTDLKKRLDHQTKSVTILKLDVEEWELFALPNIISDGLLNNVKQLLVEFHITMRPEPRTPRYIRALGILKDLYDIGFRIFWTKRNLFCRFTSAKEDIERTGCHEVSFVNTHIHEQSLLKTFYQ